MKIACLALAFVLLAAMPLRAGDATGVELTGGSMQPTTLTPDSLKSLPAVEKDVSFKTSKGVESGHYRGVLLWDVLQGHKAFAGIGHNKELALTILVSGRDGYQVAFSVGEIAPDLGNVPIMLATEADGKTIDGGMRIVAPGDQRGARAVREVARIEVR